MSGLPKQRSGLFFWGGLLVLTVLYCLYYLYFIYGFSTMLSLKGMHLVKLLFIVACYGVGLFCLKRYTVGWMVQLWYLIYLVCVLSLLLLGVIDWVYGRVPLPVRMVADTIQELLVSPFLYAVMGLLKRFTGKA